jgi:hypothetical protein
MSNQMTLPGFDDVISSAASADGNTLLSSPDGPQTAKSGRGRARASRSAPLDSRKAPPTSDISGLSSCDSSPSAALQRSLENKLRRNLDVNGSPEYVLTWKHWDMPSGPRICALRARARRISDSAFGGWPTPCGQDGTHGGPNQGTDRLPGAAALSGWPTPNAGPQNDTDTKWQDRRARIKAEKKNGNGFGMTLGMASQLAGWPTPMAGSPATAEYNEAGNTDSSRKTVELAGWATPTTRDHKDGDCDLTKVPTNGLLGRQDLTSNRGATLSGSLVPTEKRGALNPAFSLWLMGYPVVEWLLAAPSSRPSPRFRKKKPLTSSAA